MILSQADLDRCEEISGKRVGKVADIVREVSKATGISAAAIYGDSRLAIHAEARQLVMYLAAMQGVSQEGTGRALNRDHSTVAHGIKAEKKRRGEA